MNHKSIENPTKTIEIIIIIQENYFQITQIILDNNHLIIQFIEDDNQTKKTDEFSHKTDMVDQTVEKISIEITIQDQTDLSFRLIPVPIQILEIDFIQMIDLETLHIIELEIIPMIAIKTIQMIEILNIKIIDPAIILTTDQTIKNQKIITIKKDHATIHGT